MTQSELTSYAVDSVVAVVALYLSIVRIVVALLFFEHGLSKLFVPAMAPPPHRFRSSGGRRD